MQENDELQENPNEWYVYVRENYYEVAGIDSSNDVLVYATIKSFENAPTKCYMGSQKYLAERLHIGLSTVNKTISKLKKSGAITSVTERGTLQCYTQRIPRRKRHQCHTPTSI